MTLTRKTLTGITAAMATGGLMLASTTAATATEAPPGGDDSLTLEDVDTSKVYKHVWHTAPSYWYSDRVGTLYAGNNYFYCQAKGSSYEFKGYENNWWLKTDDDSGNVRVWVNAVYISGGENYERIDGVPLCDA